MKNFSFSRNAGRRGAMWKLLLLRLDMLPSFSLVAPLSEFGTHFSAKWLQNDASKSQNKVEYARLGTLYVLLEYLLWLVRGFFRCWLFSILLALLNEDYKN